MHSRRNSRMMASCWRRLTWGIHNDAGLGNRRRPQGIPWLIAPDIYALSIHHRTTGKSSVSGCRIPDRIRSIRCQAAVLHQCQRDVRRKRQRHRHRFFGEYYAGGSNYGSFPITSGRSTAAMPASTHPKVLVLKLAPSGQVIYSTSFAEPHRTDDGFFRGRAR